MRRELQIVHHLKLLPGDRIIVPKSGLKIVQHHAIYLGEDDYGNHFICENIFGRGVQMTRVNEFFADVKEVTRIEKFSGNNYNRKITVQKALSRLGKPYHLINYNCESFANEVIHQTPVSKQVNNAMGLLGFAVVIGLILNVD
jgi:signal peptidase I